MEKASCFNKACVKGLLIECGLIAKKQSVRPPDPYFFTDRLEMHPFNRVLDGFITRAAIAIMKSCPWNAIEKIPATSVDLLSGLMQASLGRPS